MRAARDTTIHGGVITEQIRLDAIHRPHTNPRPATGDVSGLAESIRQQGLIQPITVRPHPELAEQYELYDYFRTVVGLAEQTEMLTGLTELVRET
jgi:hypothetical protein